MHTGLRLVHGGIGIGFCRFRHMVLSLLGRSLVVRLLALMGVVGGGKRRRYSARKM